MRDYSFSKRKSTTASMFFHSAANIILWICLMMIMQKDMICKLIFCPFISCGIAVTMIGLINSGRKR